MSRTISRPSAWGLQRRFASGSGSPRATRPSRLLPRWRWRAGPRHRRVDAARRPTRRSPPSRKSPQRWCGHSPTCPRPAPAARSPPSAASCPGRGCSRPGRASSRALRAARPPPRLRWSRPRSGAGRARREWPPNPQSLLRSQRRPQRLSQLSQLQSQCQSQFRSRPPRRPRQAQRSLRRGRRRKALRPQRPSPVRRTSAVTRPRPSPEGAPRSPVDPPRESGHRRQGPTQPLAAWRTAAPPRSTRVNQDPRRRHGRCRLRPLHQGEGPRARQPPWLARARARGLDEAR